ncbi:MAG: SurA N-terminal domain-containing protein [Rhodanobacter sp.]
MLQAMRNKMHGWPSILLLGVSVFAMSFFGMGGYLTSQDSNSVAKVGKQEISQSEFQDRMNQVRQQTAAEQGDKFDSSLLQKPEVKMQVLDGMIDQRLLLTATDKWGMRVSDKAVRDYIAAIPQFQLNGQFDPTSYRTFLESQRKTPGSFESEIRSSLAAQLLPSAIADSTIVSDAQVDQFLGLAAQRRDLRYIVLPKPILDDEKVTDAQAQAYYKAHLADYMNPEQVAVKYLEVDAADLKPETAPDDNELKKRYEDEKQRFVQPEQRLASHVLIDVPTNATPAQQKAALAQAEKIAAQATPADFAELASKESQDAGSKRQGGDLGWLEKGVTTPAFDSALFALDKGQISKPVLSTDGYHIIWLRDIRAGAAKPFAEVREQLVKEASTSERDRQYNDVAGKMSDETYQNPSSLEPAATALDLPIKTTGLFSREGGKGIAANPKVIAAAFSDDVLVQGNNSGLLDLGNNHSVVVHVDKHVPASARPLAEVRADVDKRLLDERIASASKKAADAMLARFSQGMSMDAAAAAAGVSVQTAAEVERNSSTVPGPVLAQAFLLPHPAAGKATFAAADMHDGTYALIALDKVQPGDLSKVTSEQRESLRQQMAQAYAVEATRELIDILRAESKIKYNKSLM